MWLLPAVVTESGRERRYQTAIADPMARSETAPGVVEGRVSESPAGSRSTIEVVEGRVSKSPAGSRSTIEVVEGRVSESPAGSISTIGVVVSRVANSLRTAPELVACGLCGSTEDGCGD